MRAKPMEPLATKRAPCPRFVSKGKARVTVWACSGSHPATLAVSGALPLRQDHHYQLARNTSE